VLDVQIRQLLLDLILRQEHCIVEHSLAKLDYMANGEEDFE